MEINPYEYIATKMSVNESDLKGRMSIERIVLALRNYGNIDGYDVDYWNDFIRYFGDESEEIRFFSSIEEFKEFVLGNYKLQYSNGNIVMLR